MRHPGLALSLMPVCLGPALGGLAPQHLLSGSPAFDTDSPLLAWTVAVLAQVMSCPQLPLQVASLLPAYFRDISFFFFRHTARLVGSLSSPVRD